MGKTSICSGPRPSTDILALVFPSLRRPELYRAFLHDTIEDWLKFLADPLRREGHKPREARAFATVVVAGLRGFMLDFCNTHDRKRLDRAVRLWLRTLDSMLTDPKERL